MPSPPGPCGSSVSACFLGSCCTVGSDRDCKGKGAGQEGGRGGQRERERGPLAALIGLHRKLLIVLSPLLRVHMNHVTTPAPTVLLIAHTRLHNLSIIKQQ